MSGRDLEKYLCEACLLAERSTFNRTSDDEQRLTTPSYGQGEADKRLELFSWASLTDAAVRRNGIDDQLFLLSLDGGGVRGLSSLMILKQLMEAIDPQRPPRPCDYFNMIGGTSTGGLIAIMLGRMRLTVDECILAYNELAPKVFTKVHHRISLRTGETQGRFDHIALEREVKALLRTHRMDPDALLREAEEDSRCKVFVCATSQEIGRPVVLSSYHNARRSNDALSQAKIWEAARATSAATTFFDPITIGGETFVDGATGANNPINYLWTEAGDVWGDGEGLDVARVKCLVSIGTGSPSLVPFGPDVAGLAKALKAISTDTEATASVFQKHHSKLFANGYAFRFNVAAGLESVGLHEVEKWNDIAAATRAYIQEEDTFIKVKKCALMLQERAWTNALAGDIIGFAKASIEDLNDPENHMGREGLQWLTHTTPYESWWSLNGPSSFLYCRLASNPPDCSGDSVAASLAQILPAGWKPHRLSGTEDEPSLSRSLYFQCLAEPSDGVGINRDESGMGQLTVSAHYVLVYLICQAFLVDHEHFEDLPRRILMLSSADRRWMQLATSNPESVPISVGVALLATAISTGSRPACIAIDNVHLIRASGLKGLLFSLRSLFDKWYGTAEDSLPVVLSGQATVDVTAELEGVLQVDSNTEYRECVASLHFGDWNTRRHQIDQPEEGTNLWIWKHEEYKAWYAARRGILWIEGKPGSGKSVLASSMQKQIVTSWEREAAGISEHSPSRDGSPASIIAGWFYSTRLGDVGTSHSSLLRSLVYQILCQEQSVFRDIVVEYYRKFSVTPPQRGKDRHTFATAPWTPGAGVETDLGRPAPVVPEPEFPSWCQSSDFEAITLDILGRVSASGTSIICIVDAMDEAKPTTEAMLRGAAAQRKSRILTILGALARLVVGVEGSRMKFVLLSRPEPLLELDFLRAQRKLEHTFRITLENANRTDIEVLVTRGVASLQAAIHTYDSDSDVDVPCYEDKSEPKGPPGMRRALQNMQPSEVDALGRISDYILQHARGIILWVTLILKDLQATAAAGMSTFQELESRLRSLPLELDDLYSTIIHGLRSRLRTNELQKSRNVFVLVAGAGSFGRPLKLQELWEALAVPADLEPALKSRTDPVVSNRVMISSWSDFRRQLARCCGPLIEVVKVDPDEGVPSRSGREALPGDIIQFIHRTVKDFLEERQDSDEFKVTEDGARTHVEHLARRYLALSFPQEKPPYWSVSQATEAIPLKWKENVGSLVDYLDSRMLLSFALSVVSNVGAPAQDHLDVLFELMDHMIYPPVLAWGDDQIRDHLADECRYYPGSMGRFFSIVSVKAVLLGHAALHACMEGAVTAAENLLVLFGDGGALWLPYTRNDEDVMLNVWLPYTRNDEYVMLNGALRAAIRSGLLEEMRRLTRHDRHQGVFITPCERSIEGDPFLQLATKAGFVDVRTKLHGLTKQFTDRTNAVYYGAVTVHDLNEPLPMHLRYVSTGPSRSSTAFVTENKSDVVARESGHRAVSNSPVQDAELKGLMKRRGEIREAVQADGRQAVVQKAVVQEAVVQQTVDQQAVDDTTFARAPSLGGRGSKPPLLHLSRATPTTWLDRPLNVKASIASRTSIFHCTVH
ncbi:uncharacterized protein B0H64DRAFT_371884 [Chaetomium fimeti]|uniref:PNPLA domain-containing protein n=1 Tax=Chaetomium fimeti TaxID=1854472 RepID=A0AAE0LW31_9PEZI|nr:hypothetical protein B0H64DRAFT_371884 [Chaetomium fimeti]